jgi:HK97 family phage prohead protease
MDIERRSITSELADIGIETRDGGLSGLKGYAAIYHDGSPGTEYRTGRVIERVMRGAFSKSLDAGNDVFALFNHDPNLVLGRRSSKTLRLFNDDKGLRYSIDVPNTSVGRDLLELVSRGDIRGSSFSFTVSGVEGESWRSEDDMMIRELRSVTLHDVSAVLNPAYPDASVDLRSAFERWDGSRRPPIIPPHSLDLARRRLRLLELQSGL